VQLADKRHQQQKTAIPGHGLDSRLRTLPFCLKPLAMLSSRKNFSLELEKLYKGVQPDAVWLPKVIHIDHALSDKEFDVAAQGETNGQKIVAQGHVSRQADGKYNHPE
jgi:hypothetical protein